jgi:hypothetical protein
LNLSNAKFGVNMNNAFSLSNLEYLNISGIDTFNTKNMDYMFYGLNIPNLNYYDLDMQNVKTAYGLFESTSIERLDLSKMNMRNIETLQHLCMYCSNLKYVNLNNGGSNNLVYIHDMFLGSNNIEEIHMKNFNFGKVANLGTSQGPFNNKSKLKVIDLDGAKMPSISSMYDAFNYCTELEEIDLSNIYAPKTINSYGNLFYGDSKLNYIDISGFDFSLTATQVNLFYQVPATTVYVKNQAIADKFSSISDTPSTMTFVVKP